MKQWKQKACKRQKKKEGLQGNLSYYFNFLSSLIADDNSSMTIIMTSTLFVHVIAEYVLKIFYLTPRDVFLYLQKYMSFFI